MRRRWSFWLFLAAMLCLANVLNAAESQEVKKVSLEVSSDFDFDTNATQQNNLPADVATTGKRSSIVYTQTLKAQYDLNPAGPFNLQAKYEYFQNFHTHAGFVDTMYHTWFLTPSYLLGVYRNIKVWLPCTFNYTDVGSNKYFTSFTVAPNVFHRFSKTMGYGVELRLGRRYGWLPQEFPQFYDYTSRGIGGSLGYYYFLDNGGYLQVRFNYDYVGARGSNNSASRYGLTLSGEYPLTPKFSFLLFLDLALQNNDNQFQQGRTVIFQNVPPNVIVLLPVPPESVFPKRTDKNMLLGVIATMKIYRGLEGNMHYYYTRHNSNIPFYDYTSHIVGAQLAYKY